MVEPGSRRGGAPGAAPSSSSWMISSTPDALHELRLFCLESTVWSTNRYDHGRLGLLLPGRVQLPLAHPDRRRAPGCLPSVIGVRHPMTQLWGYKYATTQPACRHTPTSPRSTSTSGSPRTRRTSIPSSGGLVVYDVEAPAELGLPRLQPERLEDPGAPGCPERPAHVIPYRNNRAVIFDSDLFHTTPALTFRAATRTDAST